MSHWDAKVPNRRGKHARHRTRSFRIGVICNRADLHGRVRSSQREPAPKENPVIENVILLILSAFLLAYLVYALLRPEKF